MANEVVVDKPNTEVVSDSKELDDLLDATPLKEPVELIEEEPIEPAEEKEESEEEQQELIDTNQRGIDLKKVREKYPEFAKTNEFRELRNAYHREAQYTELFPTLDDAKEAAENNETFEKLNDALINRGDVGTLLEAVAEASPQALKNLATNFLDAVAQKDGALYTAAITPIVKRLAKQINAAGQKYLARNKESEDGLALVATARNIMQYAFDDAQLLEKDEPQEDPRIKAREQELSAREQAIQNGHFQAAYNTALQSVNRNLEKSIRDGLDPNNSLPEFTKDALVEKIMKEVQDQVSADTIHVRRMNSLWKKSLAEGYSRESLSRIVSAYLERARPIIPTARNKYKSIALRGRSTREEPENEEQEESQRPLKIADRGRSGRAPSNDGKVDVKRADPRKIDYRNTSDDDIFEGKIKLKR